MCGVVIAAIVLAVVATWPLGLQLDRYVLQAGTDPSINGWALAWAADRIPHGLAGFWTPPAFYPYRDVLAYSENLLGVAVFVAPILWLGGSLTLAYNAAFLLAYIVSAIGAYLLARDCTGSRAAAAIGAFAFVMLPYRVAQAGHLQVQWIGWTAVALWALLRLLRQTRAATRTAPAGHPTTDVTATRTWTMIAVFVGAAVLQILSYGYAAFQLALAAIIVTVWHLASGVVLSRRVLLPIGAAAIIGIAIVAPAISAYGRVWNDRAPATSEIHENSADLGAYLDVPNDMRTSGWLPGVAQPEGRLFPGVTVSLLALLSLVPLPRRGVGVHRISWRLRGLFVTVALAAVLVSLGPVPRAWGTRLPIPSAYAMLAEWVPLFHVMRVPARFGALALLATAMLASIGVARLLAGRSRRMVVTIVVALAAAIVFEGTPSARTFSAGMPVLPDEDRRAYEWLAREPEGAVLELPIGSTGRVNYGLWAQYGALMHRHPVINGLTRIETPLQAWLGGSASPLAYDGRQADVLPMLLSLGVRHVVLRPSRFVDEAFGMSTLAALQSSPLVTSTRREGGVHVLPLAPPPPTEETAVGQRIPSAAFTIAASPSGTGIERAVDGDPATRWLSGRPQDGSESIVLRFVTEQDVARVDITLGNASLRDYPRHLRIESHDAAGAIRILHDEDVLVPLGAAIRRTPDRPVLTFTLPPNHSAALVLRQTGRAGRWYWAIDELALWARP